jgi:hypothetical protein
MAKQHVNTNDTNDTNIQGWDRHKSVPTDRQEKIRQLTHDLKSADAGQQKEELISRTVELLVGIIRDCNPMDYENLMNKNLQVFTDWGIDMAKDIFAGKAKNETMSPAEIAADVAEKDPKGERFHVSDVMYKTMSDQKKLKPAAKLAMTPVRPIVNNSSEESHSQSSKSEKSGKKTRGRSLSSGANSTSSSTASSELDEKVKEILDCYDMYYTIDIRTGQVQASEWIQKQSGFNAAQVDYVPNIFEKLKTESKKTFSKEDIKLVVTAIQIHNSIKTSYRTNKQSQLNKTIPAVDYKSCGVAAVSPWIMNIELLADGREGANKNLPSDKIIASAEEALFLISDENIELFKGVIKTINDILPEKGKSSKGAIYRENQQRAMDELFKKLKAVHEENEYIRRKINPDNFDLALEGITGEMEKLAPKLREKAEKTISEVKAIAEKKALESQHPTATKSNMPVINGEPGSPSKPLPEERKSHFTRKYSVLCKTSDRPLQVSRMKPLPQISPRVSQNNNTNDLPAITQPEPKAETSHAPKALPNPVRQSNKSVFAEPTNTKPELRAQPKPPIKPRGPLTRSASEGAIGR